ncbi:MAG: hypothetical protein JWM80_3706 [Cyanobacteria bacterium RYN_339]|nr:hypothetical protein [Cyanobacteria bacterium RYN_339]
MPEERLTVVLDTHAWIWLMNGQPLADAAREAIAAAAAHGAVLVPAIAVWEVGMLEAKGRLALDGPVLAWVERALAAPGVQLAPLTPRIAIDSTALPGELHGDPADRLIVATARQHDALLVTRDAKLLGYGFVSTVAA